jgi:membrane-bound lytic murein transglycosylase F
MKPNSPNSGLHNRLLRGHFLLYILITASAIAFLLSTRNNHERTVPVRDLVEIRKSGKLRVLLSYDPINYFIYKGTPMGYSYELAERFAKELGVQLEVVLVKDMNRQLPMLRNNEGDLVAHFLTITGQRSRIVEFSDPLAHTNQVLVQRKPTDASGPNHLLRAPEELSGKTIYVRENSAYYIRLKEIMAERNITINIVTVPGSLTTSELIRQVREGKIDYTVADDNIAAVHAVLYPELDFDTSISSTQPLAWAVRKNSPELLVALNRWLEHEKKAGNLQIIHDKYYHRQYQFRKYAVSVFYSGHAGHISQYDKMIKIAAQTLNWDWRLISSLIYEESQFMPAEVSWAGAIGLMQIMPQTAAAFRVYNLESPEANIKAGTAYLASLEKEWQDIKDPSTRLKFILASYNVGPGHVRDAQKLASKFGADPNSWEGNVERFLELKSDPKYYNDSAATLGYCNGRMPVMYTRNILNRYNLYAQVIPK